MFQVLGERALQMGVSKTEERKAEEKRGESGACGKITKCIAEKEASMSLMGKCTGVQQCMEHAPEKCSTRGERMEH